jgi:hypothetical protein
MEERRRRFFVALLTAVAIIGSSVYAGIHNQAVNHAAPSAPTQTTGNAQGQAINKLEILAIKGRAPKTGYSRDQFSAGWADVDGCDMRNYILKRDMASVVTKSPTDCTVLSGTLNDPYTGKVIHFTRGSGTSGAVQIDHVVAVSDAWQKGAQNIDVSLRAQFYNDAATWLPPNKSYRCRYVARQIAVKAKYKLWVTQAEHDAMKNVLQTCPGQALPTAS